jgi:hypothetical protein
MRITTKTLSTAALLCLFVGAGSAAFAGTGDSHFDAIVPNLQQPWNSSAQNKVFTSAAAAVHLDSVGADYHMNARICNQGDGTCGTDTNTIGDGGSAPLDAPFIGGTAVHLQLHTSEYALVRVEAIGSWHSN